MQVNTLVSFFFLMLVCKIKYPFLNSIELVLFFSCWGFWFDCRYAAAKKLGSNVKVCDVLEQVSLHKGLNMYDQAKFVVDTLNRFMSSADEFITTAHVPNHMMHETRGKIVIEHSAQMVRSRRSMHSLLAYLSAFRDWMILLYC